MRTTATATALALLLVACGGSSTAQGPAPATAACAVAEPQTLQGGGHLLGAGAPPVPYSSNPPTSGWHASGGGPATGAYATALAEPDQVAVLERGGVVVVTDPGLPPTTAAVLAELSAELGGDVVVTPHVRTLPTPVTLTAWGVLQRCDVVGIDDVAAFVAVHGGAVDIDH